MGNTEGQLTAGIYARPATVSTTNQAVENPFISKAECFEWLTANCSDEWLSQQHVSYTHKKHNLVFLMAVYRRALSDPNTRKCCYAHEYIEGGTNAYSLNADTFFSVVMQLDDLVDFVACERVCRAWSGALKETRLWKGAVLNFMLDGRRLPQISSTRLVEIEARLESLGRKYCGDYQAIFFAQLKLWGKPVQTNGVAATLVLAMEKMQINDVRKFLENGADPSYPCGQSSHGDIRTPLESWFKTTASVEKNKKYATGEKLFVPNANCEVLELLINLGGLDIFRYPLPSQRELNFGEKQFDWTNAQFENGRTIDELEEMIAAFRPVPYALRGWRLYRASFRHKTPIVFNLK
jgi:hypothetical protein